ncbi:MAG: bacillithiol biosynthesis cysteine-adding enzyme BshC [candidate division Zixibacteria bacterium]|nr:bacillithiol biosynthesis cysteine-adding enzyme BshC [candidate division Zixibacteria bacterium]
MIQEQLVKPADVYHYSALYRDFLARDPKVNKYVPVASPSEAAQAIVPTGVDRNALCDILVRQNEAFLAKPATMAAIEKLRREDALCVFTGQQAGILGGPLYTLYKAVGVVKMAAKLQMEFDRPVVPVFWVAADDHDFDEIRQLTYLEKDGSIANFKYGSGDSKGVPASEIVLDNEDDYNAFADAVRNAYGNTDFTDEMYEHIFNAYAMDVDFVEAFARYFAEIFPDLGLIFFSPGDIDVKALSRRFFQRIVEHYFNVKTLLEETATSLEMDEYHIQAEKKQSAVHLFYHDPARKPIHFADEAYLVGEKRLALPGLNDLIERNPEQFSPDVLTRPVWQSYLFPVVAHCGGPGEIAYFCQIGKLFKLFKLPQPYYFARPSGTIIEARQEELMFRLGIKLDDFTGDVEQVINRVLAKYFPEDMDEQFQRFRRRLDNDYEALANYIVEFDGQLKPMTEQVFGKIDFALKALEKKIFSRHKKQMKDSRAQIYRMASALYPDRNLQERTFSINDYIAKYGPDVVEHIIDKLSIDTTDHQMIPLSDFRG